VLKRTPEFAIARGSIVARFSFSLLLVAQPLSQAAAGGIFLGDDVFQLALGAFAQQYLLRGFFNLGLSDRTVGKNFLASSRAPGDRSHSPPTAPRWR
jgi:hypothetical protein